MTKQVGFWAPARASVNPRAVFEGDYSSLPDLIAGLVGGLPRAEGHIDPTWDAHERACVVAYVTNMSFQSTAYMGWSDCRICGCHNGTRDFTDGTYVWPEGFGHYIRDHYVKPPRDFIDHVMRRAPRQDKRRPRRTSR